MSNKHLLWTEKYRPKTISEYIFQNSQHKSSIMRMIEDKTIPHLLFSGTAGSGKTTLSQLLIKYMQLDETDIITINASDERGIDTFRDKIKNFASSMAMGKFKIIHLEECDMLTPPAQDALKRFMEEMSEYVRFILTCNTVSKIITPIRSRCQEFYFKAADPNDIAEYVISILANESVRFDLSLVDKYVTFAYPDVRKIVNLLQQNSIDGVLQQPMLENDVGDYKFKLIDLIERDKWVEIRKLICTNASSDEWESLFRFVYENISKSPKFQQTQLWEEAIIIIAEHLYKHSIVSDPEINFSAMAIRLGQL